MPSYWWAGPGYGDYSDGLAGHLSPSQYIDITAFGAFFPGETQYALNRYNEMVAQNFSAAQQTRPAIAYRVVRPDPLAALTRGFIERGHG